MTPMVTIERGALVVALIGAVLLGSLLVAVLAVVVARGVAKRRERMALVGETQTVSTVPPPRLSKLDQRLLGARPQWQTVRGVTGVRSWN